MNPAKEAYIQRIRSESAYPTFRSLISIIAMLLYALGGLFLLIGVFGGMATIVNQGFFSGVAFTFMGCIGGCIYIITGKVTKEASAMIADIADSMTDINYRYEQQKQP